MSCTLLGPSEGSSLPLRPLGTTFAGTLVSSLHRLKDVVDNNDGAYFIFGDLSIKIEGVFRLQFNLYDMRDKECSYMQSIKSDPFTVYGKNFPGMLESTQLTRSFSDQGVRLRLRKEPRTLLRKRNGPASEDYQPRRYNRQRSQCGERQASESQDPSRQNQAEHAEPMQLPIHSPPYDQRAQISRAYSQSTASMSGYSDDTSSKRPQTSSEQGSTFSQHQQPLDSPTQYPNSRIDFENFSPFAAQQQQQSPYGYNYTQPPQSSSMLSRTSTLRKG
jgi:hypothetical protein